MLTCNTFTAYTTKMNNTNSRITLIKEEPIPLRLTRPELDDAVKTSKTHNISRSDLARRAYRLGLPLAKEQLGMGVE